MKKSNVMKWANRGLALLFASAFTIATVACDGKEGAQPSAKAVVWTAEGTRKVLQDTDYEPLHSNKKLTIKAFRNEFEAAQIIITPDKDVENYTVALSDLTNANGDVLSKDSFQIYHEKYIEVTQAKDGTALTGGGFYPDALVPYENIVAVGENKIAANENQGVWVELNPSKDQPAGVYTGAFKVQVDGKNYDVPVEITVYDYTLSDVSYAKSCFGGGSNINIMELDASIEKQEQYYEFMLDHRMTGNTFPGFSYQTWNTSDTIVQKYVDYVEKYYPHPHMTEYNLVYMQNQVKATTYYQDEWQEVTVTAPDEDFFKRILDALVERSLTSGYNLLDKASTYFMFLDEYAEKSNGPYRANYAMLAADIFYQETAQKHLLNWSKTGDGEYAGLTPEQNTVAKALHDELLNDPMDTKEETALYTKMSEYGVAGDMEAVKNCFVTMTAEEQEVFDILFAGLSAEKQAIIDAILHIYNKITGRSVDTVYAKATFVPYYSIYEGEELRNRDAEWMDYWYGDDGEMWWYGCMNPDPPYTTYHIEDELLSARLLGWMMYEYDIVGNLYWTTLYMTDNMQDYYDTALRFPQANGDGFLAYPGRPYGVDGPVASIRMKSILDGNEDYDLLYALEEFYKTRVAEKGETYDESGFKTLMSYLTQNSYDGASCIYDTERLYLNDFAAMREISAALLEMAQNAGVCIEKFQAEGDRIDVTLSADTATKLYVGGKLLSGETSQISNGASVITYETTVRLSEAANYFQLKAEKGEKVYSTSVYLGGKAVSYDSATLLKTSDFKMRTFGTVEATAVDGVAAWKINYGSADTSSSPAIMPFADINVKAFGIESTAKTLIIEIYVDLDDVILSVGGSDKGGFKTLKENAKLKKGWNQLRVEVSGRINTLRLTSGTENTSVSVGTVTVLG